MGHFPLVQSPGSSPAPALTSPPPPLLPSSSSQLYLQARAPPEGDSDLATRLLTEPDVQKVPLFGWLAQAAPPWVTHPGLLL